MGKVLKKITAMALSVVMILTLVPYMGSITAYADDQEPAPIQDTYVIGGVTYYNTGSTAFTRDQNRFYKELLGTRSDKIKLSIPKAGVTDKNCSIADAWLLMGLALTQHKLDLNMSTNGMYETLARVAIEGSYKEEDDDGSLFIDGKRYDLTAATSLKKPKNMYCQISTAIAQLRLSFRIRPQRSLSL